MARFENIELTENEALDIKIDSSKLSKGVDSLQNSFMVKILTNKTFNRAAKAIIKHAWGVTEWAKMWDLGENLFQVVFENEADLINVYAHGPWTFDDNLILYKRWEPGMTKDDVTFENMAFWVQLWELPMELRTPGIAKQIGNHIGEFLDWDDDNDTEEGRGFVRILVRIPIGNALPRGGYLPS